MGKKYLKLFKMAHKTNLGKVKAQKITMAKPPPAGTNIVNSLWLITQLQIYVTLLSNND